MEQEKVIAGKRLVLVVDDDPDIVKIVRGLLEGEGHDVRCAYDGQEALKRIEERRPDVLMIDRSMPGMDGLEVLSRLKESPRTSSIPVILLTAMDKFDDVSEGYQKGADCYITKPFSKTQILNGINLVLSRRSQIPKEKLELHAVAFLRACSRLIHQTERLAGLFAAQEGLSPGAWLYKWLEARVKTDQVQTGSLKSDPEWRYCFRGWGVDFENTKTGERADLAIGPGGRCDTFDEWRVQCYIENQAQRGPDFAQLDGVIKEHSDAVTRFVEHLSHKGWIEPAKPKETGRGEYDAQLGDRWTVSEKGVKALG